MSMNIELEGVEKEFRIGGRTLPILRGIDLLIPEQSVVALVGPSGSGKTTLLGLMAGLDSPTRGRVLLGTTDLTGASEEERAAFRARHVGFVFQTFHLLPSLTARENVQVPLELHPDKPAGGAGGIRRRAEDLLARVGLGDRVDHYPAQLSGGERQRVALARAFSARPAILFADEPTGNLDRATGAGIVELLEELNREAKTTLVLVTHDMELASRAGRVYRMVDGTVQREGATTAAVGGAGEG
ncbi:MAG: ABC transporter ATP-binding protein [Gemmatimonadales bacterium]|nr:MAG: ABC transporter ATP-binding protein [Gemmatimonadales bacterium]